MTVRLYIAEQKSHNIYRGMKIMKNNLPRCFSALAAVLLTASFMLASCADGSGADNSAPVTDTAADVSETVP